MKVPYLFSAALLLLTPLLPAQDAKVIFGPGVEGWEKMVKANGEKQTDVSFTTGESGVDIKVQENGTSSFPGIRIAPEKPWDISAYGRVDATIKNTGAKPARISMRVDDISGETGSGSVGIQPGESRTVSVYLDYAAKSKLKGNAIPGILIFGSKLKDAQSYVVEKVAAAGPPGEKPPVDPKTAAVRPARGIIVGEGVPLDLAKQTTAVGMAKAATEGGAVRIDLTGGKEEGITVKPAMGFWNLNDYFQVRVKVKNTGAAPVTPSVRIESKDGPTAAVAAGAPVAPGATAEIVVPFVATVPWEGADDPDMGNEPIKKDFHGKPGTGTKFVSHRATGVTILGDTTADTKKLLVTSVAAENPTDLKLPEWLGQRPPVEGEWTKTFEDNFDGTAVDLTKWNIYGPNFWDKRTHFSKDNAIVKDGTLTLRVEKKTGRHNDSPDGKETDYATGFADTYGKWVQRYGYFEARVKLPKAPCMWPAFWLMPDRGLGNGDQGRRQSTKFGGMEFDIIEQLSIWGSQRFNVAFHWDGYGAGHKATGSGSNYVAADKDGYITVGLLWTPGSAIVYGNGQPIAKWENPRVSSAPSCILLDLVTGGWETESLDDSQLPADFVVDYIRCWQRSDLASPVDGPKPNKGTPAAPTE